MQNIERNKRKIIVINSVVFSEIVPKDLREFYAKTTIEMKLIESKKNTPTTAGR